LKSLLGNSKSEVENKPWDIDEIDFFETSSEEVTPNVESPFKRQNVSGRQHGLSFIIAVEEDQYTCPVVNGMGVLVSEMILYFSLIIIFSRSVWVDCPYRHNFRWLYIRQSMSLI
jgi:hypothetical protein